jgi:putative phage-type endonuclease
VDDPCSSSEQGTEKWKVSRQSRLTASDFATAIGKNAFCYPETLLLKKILGSLPCEQISNNVNVQFENDAIRWGKQYEKEAIHEYEKVSGHVVVNMDPGLCVNPGFCNEYGNGHRFGASPDGITYCGILVEAKCPYTRKIPKRVPKSVPSMYSPQVQGMLSIFELEECHFIQYDPRIPTLQIIKTKKDPWTQDFSDVLNEFIINFDQKRELYTSTFYNKSEQTSFCFMKKVIVEI